MNVEEIKRVIDYGLQNIKDTPKLYKDFERVYNQNIKEYPICAGCPGGFESAYNYLVSVYNKNKNQKDKKKMDPNQKFILKDGGVIHSDLSPVGVFTPENCSDEDAINLLQRSENYINSFKKFPENWKELVANEPTFADKVTGKVGKKEEKKNKAKDQE